MKKLLNGTLITIDLLLLMGCANIHVKQVDESPGARKITSEFTASAWLSSAQTITKFRASMSDKTTAFGGSTLGQQGATNMVEALSAIARILEAIKPTQ